MSSLTAVSPSKSSAPVSSFTSTSKTLEKIKGLTLFSGGLGFIPVGLLALTGTINPLFILIPVLVQLSSAGFHLLAKQVFLKRCMECLDSTQDSTESLQSIREKKAALKALLTYAHQEESFITEDEYQTLLHRLDVLDLLIQTTEKITLPVLSPSTASPGIAHSDAILDRDIRHSQDPTSAEQQLARAKKQSENLVQGFTQAMNRQKQKPEDIDVDDLIAQMNSALSESDRQKRATSVQAKTQADYEQTSQKRSADMQAANILSTPDYQARYAQIDPMVDHLGNAQTSIRASSTALQPSAAPSRQAIQVINNPISPAVQQNHQVAAHRKAIKSPPKQLAKITPSKEGISFLGEVLLDFFNLGSKN
jgi:hypothetical protein